jgi:hypothetical protein
MRHSRPKKPAISRQLVHQHDEISDLLFYFAPKMLGVGQNSPSQPALAQLPRLSAAGMGFILVRYKRLNLSWTMEKAICS